MNRIYRVVFNRATGTYGAASELAKTGGKKKVKTVLAAAALALALPGISMAATISSTDPSDYPYVVTSGTTSFVDTNIDATGADVNLSTGSVQKHGVIARTNGDTRAVINLGDENTESISITVDSTSSNTAYNTVTGISAINDSSSYAGGKVVVTAENLTINVKRKADDGFVYGILAQNRTTSETDEDKLATVIINAENTVINAEAENGEASGLVAMSQGIIKVNGNLEVNADNAIVARGGAVVQINADDDGNSLGKTVKLNGDINFNYNGETSGTPVDADVTVNLDGADSYWTGNAVMTSDTDLSSLGEDYKSVSGLTLNISNSAQWNVTAVEENSTTMSTAINNLGLNSGIINISTAGQTVVAENLSGTGGTINLAAEKEGETLTNASLQVNNVTGETTPHLDVNITGITADDVTDADMAQLATTAVTNEAGTGAATGLTQTQTVAEGITEGTRTQIIDENGNVVSSSIAKNTITAGMQEIAVNNFLVFRAQINDVSKRMGDLRTMPQADGMWARAIAGQSEYKSMHNTYQTLQIGGDKRIGNFYVGGTASYTDGDGKLKNGSTDDKNYSFGLYGGWINDDGQYIDVIVKRHKLDSDFDLYNLSGTKVDGRYHTWGTSASVEYGWRLGIANTDYYVEPQAEFQIAHLNGVSYTTSAGSSVKQDGIDSVVGRLGIAAGWVSPEKTGSAYIKASVLHDWEGDSEIRHGNNRYTEDTGGTWGEFALGGTWNINKNFAAYGEVETTAGNPVRTTYQVSGGIRYSF